MKAPLGNHFPQIESNLVAAFHYHRWMMVFAIVLAVPNFVAAELLRRFAKPEELARVMPLLIVLAGFCLGAALWHRGKAKHKQRLHSTYFPALSLK